MLVSFAHICIRVKFLGHIFRQISYVTAEIKLHIFSFLAHSLCCHRLPKPTSKKPIWIFFLFTFGYLTENNGFPLTRTGKFSKT